jgi:hypothetical protein
MADGGVWVKVHPDDAGGGAPGAAVIGGATGAVTKSSFTGDGTNGDAGQAYDVYEFTGSGELVVSEPGFVDALVVAGGGGGSNNNQRGGGAGGMLTLTQTFIDKGPSTIIVGAGLSGSGNYNEKGGNSKIGSLIAYGGGAGCGPTFTSGVNGGSGGAGNVAGSGLENQGNDGYNAGGGGGGGGGAGGQGTAGSVDSGGLGKASFITGAEIVYASGGNGGGSSNAVANKGNGGEGSNSAGGNGGSGYVCVRVKVPSESYPFRTRTTAPRTAHAARIEDGIVRQVIVIPHLDDDDAKITEYCNRIGLPGTWVDTSYTGSRRGKYAGVGDLFDLKTRNAEFVSPVIEDLDKNQEELEK